MQVITGGAKGSKGNKTVGDQAQTSIPDYKNGEVSMAQYELSSFKSVYAGFWVFRPLSVTVGQTMASIMVTACNNPNIGYLNVGGSGEDSNQGIFRYGENSTVPCNCDCSSLVSYCITKGAGYNINTGTYNLRAKLFNSGLFYPSFGVSLYSESNPPLAGDVLVMDTHELSDGSSGNKYYPNDHVEMVVQGGNAAASGMPTGYMGGSSLDYSVPIPSNYKSSTIQKGSVSYDSFNGRTIGIYTPYGYNAATAYSIFYFKMGMNGTAQQFWNGGLGNIIDNLILNGEIKPIIFVTIQGESGSNVWLNPNIGGLVSYVESKYHTYGTPSTRALGGWSQGSIEVENVLVNSNKNNYYQLFAWFDIQSGYSNSGMYTIDSSPFVGVVAGSKDDPPCITFTKAVAEKWAANPSYSKNVTQIVDGYDHYQTSQLNYLYNAIRFIFSASGQMYGFNMLNWNMMNFNMLNMFNRRMTAPMPGDEAYLKYYSHSYGINSNGWYAWGRFSEILERECSLCRQAARRWYSYNEDGYQRGVSPCLGAVMCFTNLLSTSEPGMVCIVEEVGTDYVMVSNYSLKTGEFEYIKITKHNGAWDLDLDGSGTYEFMFQGFIYNPNVQLGAAAESKLYTFINNAKAQSGNGREYVEKYTPMNDKYAAWSAAFVVAVAKETGGLIGEVIPETYSCTELSRSGVNGSMGTWIDGPVNGGNPLPQPGDIAMFRYSSTPPSDQYQADKAGIVVAVDGMGGSLDETNKKSCVHFTYVMGDSSSKIETKNGSSDADSLMGIYRPDWDKVDGMADLAMQFFCSGGFYAQSSSTEDATIRDLKYVSISGKGIEPSISSTGVLLCAINYTGVLENVYNVFAQTRSSNAMYPNMITGMSGSFNQSAFNYYSSEQITGGEGSSVSVRGFVVKLDSTTKQIYSTLFGLFNNPAGAVGFMANMVAESGLRTNALNSIGASGLCQWLGGRKTAMYNHCINLNGMTWENNLTGQLSYLTTELNGSYKDSLSVCQQCSPDIEGAKVAAEYVLRHFEIPGHYETNVPIRNDIAVAIWGLLFGG